MKILLFVPLWHRPEIVAIFIKNLKATLPSYAEVIPYFVLSPEDECFSDLLHLTDGYDRTMTPNNPFGKKKNTGLERALSLNWDYLMELNSDTVFTPTLWDYHYRFLTEGFDCFGFKNLYVYEPYLNKAVWVEGYHVDWDDTVTALGPGRCIKRDVVEKCMPLWESEAPFGMDGYSDARMKEFGYEVTLIDNGREPVICDIKGTVCLTAWYDFEGLGEAVDVNYVRDSFNVCRAGCMDLQDFDGFHNAVLKISGELSSKAEGFELINEAYRLQNGERRYSSYGSYRVAVTKKFKSK